MSKKSRETPEATTAVATVANVIANERPSVYFVPWPDPSALHQRSEDGVRNGRGVDGGQGTAYFALVRFVPAGNRQLSATAARMVRQT